MERDLGVNILTSLRNIVVINDFSCDDSSACSYLCKRFYPQQSCSNICGVVVVCMGAVLSDHWRSWLTWGHQMEVPLLSNPSMNSTELRLMVVSWIANNSVNTHNITPERLMNSIKMYTPCNTSHSELSDACDKHDSTIAYEGKPSLDACTNAKVTKGHTEGQ